ncbi:MAG: hypothetical protein A3F83_09120 [Candidatus Glassbacteria bacterium RIFCSPLOWO2_12_FULL_58_11]|uniref:Cyclic nucleotide-binding domain-containing protein n=2 Tax=Candidatus Glassiibacteriota TaxID=1817805 RepID=A0A1F5YTH5_9BACT|nr:MAG: hypothetical protein A2Z86_02505 [Candidatus Glassbacteria bacterium GWA2_58_10]OGG03508.1 MAG: hypothetical protein A3F83_09120 [Candidatus Glassbacteria bacterium RIFCSPLOWO2_12_FULL_58_11]
MLNIKKTFKPGDIIVRENTLGNSAYIIESGKVEVSKNIGNQRVVFTTLEKGSIFGEMCLVDNSPRSATVTTLEETVVTILSKTNFQQFLMQNPAAQSIFQVITERLRQTDVLVNPLRLTNFYYSLTSLIYYLALAVGNEKDGELSLENEFLLNECCTILAVDRSLAEKVVNRMVFTKLVRLDKNRGGPVERKVVVIPNQSQFKEFVDFLATQSSKDNDEASAESLTLSDKTYDVLKVLVENVADYQPKAGKKSVYYEKFLTAVNDLLNLSREETDKLFQPLFKNGWFKITMDPETNTRQLVCIDPARLESELERQSSRATFQKMVNLLKTMAAN